MSIQIVRAFVHMCRSIGAASHLSRKLDALEQLLMDPPSEEGTKGQNGFH